MTAGGRRHPLAVQVPLVAWLVLVWILLWGTFSWANLLSGIAVALLVKLLLPLPRVAGGSRFRPLAVLRFLGHFALDLLSSSVQVAAQAFLPGGGTRGAVVAVRMRTGSELLLTIIAETLSLVPGSIAIDLDPERRLIALHLLSARDLADVEQQKARVRVLEERVVRAFGSAEAVAALEEAGPATRRRTDATPGGAR